LNIKAKIAEKCGVVAPFHLFNFVSRVADASRRLSHLKKGFISASLTPKRHNALGILILSTNRDFSTGLTSASADCIIRLGSKAGRTGTCAGFACFCKVPCWFG
jgi:hypothetical protein